VSHVIRNVQGGRTVQRGTDDRPRRRLLTPTGLTAVAGAAAAAVALATVPAAGSGDARTAPGLSAPTGMHVASVSHSSVTIAVHRTDASKYRVWVSSVKADVFYKNLHNGSTHRKTVTSSKPSMTVSGLKYLSTPYYYRVATMRGGNMMVSHTFKSFYLAPNAPSGVSATATSNGLSLSWTKQTVVGDKIEQATDSSFSHGVRNYTMTGLGTVFTPYGLTSGQTYYFRVRATNSGSPSKWSKTVSATPSTAETPLRVMSYNTLDSSFTQDPGGPIPAYSKRLPGILKFMKDSGAAVIGEQEGNSCLHAGNHTGHCYRDVDAMADGLKGTLKLADTDMTSAGKVDYFGGNYIFYNPNVLKPVGTGGQWELGYSRAAAYQAFKVRATGAKFIFSDAHLVTPSGSKYDTERGKETQSMLAHYRDYSAKTGIKPVVFVGDFNSHPDKYKSIDKTGNVMHAAGIPDGFEVAQKHKNAQYDSINNYYRTAKKGHGSSDHVYGAPGVGIVSWKELLNIKHGKFVGVIPSDHNPVVSDLRLPSPANP
jgi:hypothetical protein